MKVENFKPFKGQHCETTATGSLLNHIGISLSEPMLFGIGEGLSYIYWNMKQMDFPFIGGRVKTDLLTEHICRNLNLKLDVKETSSIKKAWGNVVKHIELNCPVGLKLDCYHLDYFTNKIHFAGHYVAMYGYDDKYAYLIDTEQQGGKVQTTLENLQLARSEKGPMSSKNLSYTISGSTKNYNLKKVVKEAIRSNAQAYLTPPITNISYKGILKTSVEIKKWFATSRNIKDEFQTAALLMEKGGTGGAIFRNLYRDFLSEAFDLLKTPAIKEGYNRFVTIAPMWTQVSSLFEKAGATEDIKYINEASEILKELSELERKAMELLKF